MANKFNKTLIGAAVLAALSGAPAAYAFDIITVDRDGSGGTASIDIANLGWAPSTVLLQNAFTMVDDGFGGTITANSASYNLWTQGVVGGFNLGGGGSMAAVVGSEWTFQLGMTQEPLGPVLVDAGNATQTYLSQLAVTPTVNFFKIFYDATAGTLAKNLPGTGHGDDYATAGSCDTTLAGNAGLILCGTIIDGGVNAILKTGTTLGDATAVLVPLDGFGIDNYDGVSDGTAAPGDITAIGTVRSPAGGGGSLNVDVDVTYQNFDFFISNISTINVGIDLNQNANLKLNFQQTDPSRSVVGNTWSVGTDTDTVTDTTAPVITTRAMNNFKCNTTDVSCSFVAQTTGTTSFNGSVVPEPNSVALIGLGLLTIGVGALRRRKRLA